MTDLKVGANPVQARKLPTLFRMKKKTAPF
jgi:hypothetical protein